MIGGGGLHLPMQTSEGGQYIVRHNNTVVRKYWIFAGAVTWDRWLMIVVNIPPYVTFNATWNQYIEL